MPHHEWDDEWFKRYGPQLACAEQYIYSQWKRRTGRHIHLKEKYGTIRVEYTYTLFWPDSWPIASYFYPGHLYYKLPRWMMKIEGPLRRFIEWTGFGPYMRKKQYDILIDILTEVVRRYPTIRHEILADFRTSLKLPRDLMR